jgi:membrane dipeptidase
MVAAPLRRRTTVINRRHFLSSPFAALIQPEQTNPRIRAARDAAMAVLKPSEKDLQHGLELHAASLVIESYGFSPRCLIDGARMKEAIDAGAGAAELDDLHTEMLLMRAADDPTQLEEHLDAWKAAGVDCVLQNAGEESSSPLRILKRLAHFTYLTDTLSRHVARAAFPADIEAAKKQGRRSLYLTANGIPLPQEWSTAAEELALIRLYFQLGIRMMHVTYNRRNVLGDGCAEPADAGLSELGRAAIAEMNRVGVIIDVSHSGWRTSLETAKASSKPVVASHTGAVAVRRHIRAKPDEVLRAIADTGGYSGVYSVASFLGGNQDLNAMLDHIEYMVKKFGAGHVAIGTDLAYIPARQSEEYRKMGPRPRSRPRYEALWPPGALDSRSHPSLAWVNWPMITVGMVQRRIPDDAIRKILGENVLRVARAVLPQAA